MLESASDRLLARGGPHFNCPDKVRHSRTSPRGAAIQSALP